MENLISTNRTAMVNQSTMQEIMAIPLPEATSTYRPVAHKDVIEYVQTELVDLLPEFRLRDNVYGLSSNGQGLFGMITFEDDNDYMGPSIAFRNSYNKTMALAFAFGSQVFVCANGMLTGDVIVAKKHTLNVWESMRELVRGTIGQVRMSYGKLQTNVDELRKIPLTYLDGCKTLGVLRGEKVLSPRIFEKSLTEWIEPSFKEHKDGSALQLYNACTEGLKAETSPGRAMKQRIALHDVFTSEFDLAAA